MRTKMNGIREHKRTFSLWPRHVFPSFHSAVELAAAVGLLNVFFFSGGCMTAVAHLPFHSNLLWNFARASRRIPEGFGKFSLFDRRQFAEEEMNRRANISLCLFQYRCWRTGNEKSKMNRFLVWAIKYKWQCCTRTQRTYSAAQLQISIWRGRAVTLRVFFFLPFCFPYFHIYSTRRPVFAMAQTWMGNKNMPGNVEHNNFYTCPCCASPMFGIAWNATPMAQIEFTTSSAYQSLSYLTGEAEVSGNIMR